MRIVGLSGPKLSGKGTIARYLIDHKHAVAFSMSGVLSDIAKRMYMENTRANLIAIATGLRSQFGQTILAEVLAKDIARSQNELIVIDGIRLNSEVDIFSKLTGFELWYVDASVEERFQRAKMRGEKVEETTMTFEEFVAQESAVTEKEIQSLRLRAQHVLDNVTSMDDLYQEINTLL
ncbi:MAG: AAA family ATPase [Candidatus Kerfeldbacteria bacterium]|nr:AAA family ATPase [Candidatus Kerfeldbacteria bacterium]